MHCSVNVLHIFIGTNAIFRQIYCVCCLKNQSSCIYWLLAQLGGGVVGVILFPELWFEFVSLAVSVVHPSLHHSSKTTYTNGEQQHQVNYFLTRQNHWGVSLSLWRLLNILQQIKRQRTDAGQGICWENLSIIYNYKVFLLVPTGQED